MMCKIKNIMFSLLLACSISPMLGQADGDIKNNKKQSWPISFTVSNHSWSFPMTNVFRIKPLYPGFSVGTEFYYIKKEKGRLFQTFEIGGFANSNQGSATYFNSNLTYRFTARFGLMTEVGIGLGYFHGFQRSATYEQTEAGTFAPVKDNGIPASSSNISFALGYDLSKVLAKNITPFVRYQWIASTNYWSNIGIRPNGLLHLGIQIDFK